MAKDDEFTASPLPTVAAVATVQLKRDIVSGIFAPEHRLRMRELEERYGLGATPLREALVGLAAAGLIVAEGQKGFRVPPISKEDLIDITSTRQLLECEAFRQSLAHGGAAWEDEVVTSFHLLRRELERQDPRSAIWLDTYEARHHRFHRSLIAACPLATLRGYCDSLYDRMTRYRRVLRAFGKSASVSIAAHQSLMDLALTRDSEPAVDALRSHVAATSRAVLKLLQTLP